jgi:hypothetical protein
MDLQSYLNEAESVERDGVAAIASAADADALEAARIAFLGDRQGRQGAAEALRAIAKTSQPRAAFNEARSRWTRRSPSARRCRAAASVREISRRRRASARRETSVTLVIEEIERSSRSVHCPDEADTEAQLGSLNSAQPSGADVRSIRGRRLLRHTRRRSNADAAVRMRPIG